MDEITIFWTHTALKQRNSIFEYWNNRNKSKSFSIALNTEIRQRLKLLKTQPEMGKMIGFQEYRAVFIRQFSMIYYIDESSIIISSFWDNRQDPKKLLALLKE